MIKKRKVYTTGQAAEITNVASRTVSKWFDEGKLKGYRIPGSSDRRIPHDSLITFLSDNGMPIPEEIQDEPVGTEPVEADSGD